MLKRNVGIVCTLGPASHDTKTIAQMARAGMTIARINFSHGHYRQHLKTMQNIRLVNKRCGYKVKILQDLEGFRIRIGELKRPRLLKEGEYVWIVFGPSYNAGDIPLDFNVDVSSLKKGMRVFINDGMIELAVVGGKGRRYKLEVIHGGKISSRKGVNIPGLKLKSSALTQKDKEDVIFGIKEKVDFIALSFVRHKHDMRRLRKIVQPYLPKCRLIGKIESREGMRNLDDILDASDGIIVARGDLGVSLPIYEIPLLQKKIIKRCNKKKKFVITATQMLESMTEFPRPTRAEVTDVANAILDGSDYVMLSGETAVGKYPVETVRMMKQIITYTEKFRKFI